MAGLGWVRLVPMPEPSAVPRGPLRALTAARVLTGFPVFGVSEVHTYGPQKVAASAQSARKAGSQGSGGQAVWSRGVGCSRKQMEHHGGAETGVRGQRGQPGRTPVLEELRKPHRPQAIATVGQPCRLALQWLWPGAVTAGPRAGKAQNLVVDAAALSRQSLEPQPQSLGAQGIGNNPRPGAARTQGPGANSTRPCR